MLPDITGTQLEVTHATASGNQSFPLDPTFIWGIIYFFASVQSVEGFRREFCYA